MFHSSPCVRKFSRKVKLVLLAVVLGLATGLAAWFWPTPCPLELKAMGFNSGQVIFDRGNGDSLVVLQITNHSKRTILIGREGLKVES